MNVQPSFWGVTIGKLRFGILDSGYLADIIVEVSLKGVPDKYELVRVLGRTREKTELLVKRGGRRARSTIDELLMLAPDYVMEAASVQSVKDCRVKVLASGASIIVLSIGTFADKEFYGQVKETTVVRGTGAYTASGVVGGFGMLRTIPPMGQVEAGTRIKKGPTSLKGTPLFEECLMEDTQEGHAFHSNIKEAISLLPTKMNAAAASFLATVGLEDTRADIYSTSGMVGDGHKITSEIEGVKAIVDIHSSTSAITGRNVVAALQSIVSPIVP